MPFEFRMAWREFRPAFKKFLFMVVAVALGVGSVTGIKGFSQALDHAMSRSARDLIAADLAVRMNSEPDEREQKVLHRLVEMGAEITPITETLSMASTEQSQAPLLVTLKAVDPKSYPFYGDVVLEPALSLRDALQDDSTVATQEFLIRTRSALGDSVKIGAGNFRIAAVLRTEPDRVFSGVELGPRIMISRAGLSKTNLIQFGSRASRSFLYRLPAKGLELETARGILKAGLQASVRIADYRDPNPSVSRGLDRTTSFLSLIGMLSLLVGGLGVATTIHAYLQQKLDSIAVIKCLGGRSAQIIRIYLIQGLFIGTLGSILGVGLGYLIQVVFPRLVKGLIELPTDLEPAPGAVVQGFLIGIVTTLLFLLPPLLAIRKIQPARVLLREMPETHYSTLRRLRHDPLLLFSALILIAGIGLLASWLAHSWQQGFSFVGGLAGAILLLTLSAKLLLVGLRHTPRPSSLALRHGLKNLNRPGNHVASVLVALGVGVAFTLTVYLIQTSLLSQIVKSAPSNYPNVFLFGITERDKGALWDFVKKQPGIQDPGIPIPAVPARLQRIDGKTENQIGLPLSDRHYFHIEFVLTWTADIPPDTRILEGQWWKPPFQTPMASVGLTASRILKIRPGSTVEFLSSGSLIQGKVVNIRDVDFSRPGTNNQFIFSPGALEGLPTAYMGTLRVSPSQVGPLQAALFARFPNVTSLDVGQVLTTIQKFLDKIANIIRFVTFSAILAGIIILASSVVSTRYQRIREAALLKTLGATRAQIARIQAAEFLVVGTVAGLIGCLLAAAAADYLLGHLLDTEFSFRWAPLLVGTSATAALAIATGWIASRGVLNHKPLEVLREN